MAFRFIGSFLVLCGLILVSCADFPEGPYHPRRSDSSDTTGTDDTTGGTDTTGGNNGGGSGPVDSSVCFTRDILPILISNCTMAECHDVDRPEEGINPTSYASVMNGRETIVVPGNPSRSKLYESLIEDEIDERMPPPPRSLTNAQIALIERWIREGAKNRDCSSENSGCDTSVVTYVGTIAPLLASSCTGCHTGYAASGGVDLTSRSTVEALAKNGSLMGTISWKSGYPKMPPSGPKMTDCSISQIQAWINGGLK